MLERALLIARKDLFLRFTDRNLLLMLLVVPLALPVIIALVFGNFGGPAGAPALRDIPLAIVNLDAGAEQQGRELNHGVGLVQLLTGHAQSSATDALSEACPSAPGQSAAAAEGENTLTLDALFAAREMQDVTAGRALVDEGELAALVIIPPDFSARLSPRIGPGAEPLYPTAPVPIEVYSDSRAARWRAWCCAASWQVIASVCWPATSRWALRSTRSSLSNPWLPAPAGQPGR